MKENFLRTGVDL